MRNTFEVRNHIQKVHLDKKAQDIENKSKDSVEEKGEYECNTCQKVLKTREGIIVHIFNAHEGERNCVFCSEKFDEKSILAVIFHEWKSTQTQIFK